MKVTLNNLKSANGAITKKKRLGRGHGSGSGKTSGRGQKGQKSRSGWSGGTRPGFEGGQTPLYMRFPKRGFSNKPFKTDCEIVNVEQLGAKFKAGDTINIETLVKAGLVKKRKPIKILGRGNININLTVEAHKFSSSARKKIEEAGGVCKEVKGEE